MKIDERYMRHSMKLAMRGKGTTNPNPIVGTCVVKNGRIVGEGFHKMAGSAHAEINALNAAGALAQGATLYVTLEPCDHFGKTPPCTDAIIRSGIRKVVIALRDPNPMNNGRGIRRLKRHGIKTVSGVLEEEAKAINRPYIKFITKRLPYVTLKVAQSLDGKIATRLGDSKWITGVDSRRYVHTMRSEVDAIMIGVNTLLRDNPKLTIRAAGRASTSLGPGRPQVAWRPKPVRIIVDSNLKTPPNARVFSSCREYPLIIATTKSADSRKWKALETRGARVLGAKARNGRVALKELFKRLAEMDIMHVMVEGGGELSAGILEEGLADRILVFVAPKIIGGREALTSIEGKGVGLVSKSIRVNDIRLRRFNEDILIEGDIA